MADDPFALSPIAARPTLPTEADYQAICEAFVETSRGRWFLNEYARRNRHSDTRQVLDAVERIEATLARQQMARAALSDAMVGGIADAVAQAKARALAALHGASAPGATLDAIRQAAGKIGDISWTLRECGADARICDLLDAKIADIADGCDHVPAAAVDADAFAAIFDELTVRLDALARGEASAPAEARQAGREQDRPDTIEPDSATEIAADIEMREVPAVPTAEFHSPEEEVEAGAPEAIDSGPAIEVEPIPAAMLETPSAPDAIPEPAKELAQAPGEPAVHPEATVRPDAVPPSPSPRSLGAALVMGGVIGDHARPDPLAPLRKMTYAEKIALFS